MFIFPLIVLVIIDAGILMALLKAINDDDIEFKPAALVALITSLGTELLAWGLASVLGAVAGVIVAGIIAAALLGVAVSAMFGAEIKRSFLIAALFIVLHFASAFAFSFLGMTQ